MSDHLHILHLEPNTGNPKTDAAAQQRYENLMIELDKENIKDYSIIGGYYDPLNPKEAIHKGHCRIIQLAKEQGLERCIIGEDDLVWSAPGAWQYFLSQIPESYDLFFSIIYQGEFKGNRVVNGFSGGMSLYVINSRFYSTFLEQPIDTHIDRQLGNWCYKYEFYVVPEYCVTQRGGFSHQLGQDMYYTEYLRDKKLYNGG